MFGTWHLACSIVWYIHKYAKLCYSISNQVGLDMPICQKCKDVFRNYIVIDGIRRNVHNRKLCISCSPFKGHNTRSFGKPRKALRCGKCGETDPLRFYGHKRSICGSCHSKYTTDAGQRRKEHARKILGNKCSICGYDTYPCSLAIHHVDPSKKDPNFRSSRGWSELRVANEIKGCILLCMNCHCALHSGCIPVST